MQQFESLIGVNPWTALFVLVNTLLIFAVAKKYLFVPVHNMIEKRQQEIKDMYAAAEAEKSSAEDLKVSYEARLSSARAEADEMVRSAMQTAQRRGDDIIGEAQLEASRIKQKAEEDISSERRQMLMDVRTEISEIAVSIASKVVEREVQKKDHDSFVDEFIRNVGEDK
ncbi:MAG: F0F1 ATP synthase subunit B [Clostridia bacterium]|nr:F0F1 ATP synthase subunit B [Clostridia bacterium]